MAEEKSLGKCAGSFGSGETGGAGEKEAGGVSGDTEGGAEEGNAA